MHPEWLRLATILCLALGHGPILEAASTAHEAAGNVTAAILAALHQSDGRLVEIAPTAAGYMQRCQESLSVSIMGHGTYRTAQVECPFPRWTVYAGISLERTEHVLVTTRSVSLGQRLGKSDLQVVPMPSGSVAGDPISARDVIGKKAAVPLAAGQIITRDQIIIPLAIRNGDKVVIHWTDAGVVVTAVGTALESGGPAQSILVENDESHRPVMATVVTRDSPAKVGQLFIVAPR